MLYLGLTSFLFLLRFALAGQGIARNQLYFIVLASLFVFSAFRYQVGCDWSGYYYQYLGATNFDWSSVTKIREPIWWAILGWIQNKGLPYPVPTSPPVPFSFWVYTFSLGGSLIHWGS